MKRLCFTLAFLIVLVGAFAAREALVQRGRTSGPRYVVVTPTPSPATRFQPRLSIAELKRLLPGRVNAQLALRHQRVVPDAMSYDVLPPCFTGSHQLDIVTGMPNPVISTGRRRDSTVVLAAVEFGTRQAAALARQNASATAPCEFLGAPPFWPYRDVYQARANQVPGGVDGRDMLLFYMTYDVLGSARRLPPPSTLSLYALSGRWFVMLSARGPTSDVDGFTRLAATTLSRVNARLGTNFAIHLPSPPPRSERANELPDPAWAPIIRRRIECGPSSGAAWDVMRAHVVHVDVTGDGAPDTVASAACPSSTSTPPINVVVFDGTSPARAPAVLGILGRQDFFRTLSVKTQAETVTLAGEAISPGAAACCPDEQLSVSYRLEGKRFVEVRRAHRRL